MYKIGFEKSISFSDVVFHDHAIKSYEKHNGVATVTTSSTLEYYYNNSESKKDYNNMKKQTRYTCKFIYIYDESKVKGEHSVLIIRCPNCGAPLRGVGKIKCSYCGTDTESINLQAWKMSDYKEDY